MRRNLQIAASKLGIEVVTPYCLEENGHVAWCLAYLPHFGGPRGMVIDVDADDAEEFRKAFLILAQKKGFFYSLLHPDTYLESSDQDFLEALTDWGYFGPPDKKPHWLR